MAQSAQHLYEFGSFRLDPSKRNLSRDGEVVQLTPKCFEILLALLDSRGEVVTKSSLIERVWPDSFVEEGNLTYNISMLRKALGERAGENQYILTVPGQGYRFAAAVREVCDKPVVSEEVRQSSSTPPQSVFGKRVTVIAALIIVLGGLLVYWIVSHSTPTTGFSSSAAVKSIAVLPFELVGDENSDSEMEYLSDGISESLINSLGQLGGLVKVIARSSSFKYKGKDADPLEVARALGVDAVVSGRVLRRGERLQISVEMIDARDKTHVWGNQYNRGATDLATLQTEISGEIAGKLRLKLSTVDQRHLAGWGKVNPQAFDLLLKGRFYANRGETEYQRKSVEYFNQAIAVDPDYAEAYADLSNIYGHLMNSSVLDPKEFTPKAEAAAQKALEIDEGLAEAHLAKAGLRLNSWDWATAGQELKRALELNPSLLTAHLRYSGYLSRSGQHGLAIAEAKRAKELDPLSINSMVGFALSLAGQYDQAIEAFGKTLELAPNHIGTHRGLGGAYAGKGMYAKAIAALQAAIQRGDDTSSTQIYLGAAYANAGEREKAELILKRLQMGKQYVSPGELAVLYVALDERERAFESLEKAYAARDLQLVNLRLDRGYDRIRSDPRFNNLLRRVGLPQ